MSIYDPNSPVRHLTKTFGDSTHENSPPDTNGNNLNQGNNILRDFRRGVKRDKS